MPIALLPDRGVVEIVGEDRVAFLQGLVSNDVALAAPDRAVWAALLTPQGKWVADFFITATTVALRLDCERAQAPMLVQRLGRFRLRSKVVLADRSATHAVLAGWGGAPRPPGAAPDSRLAAAGWRAIAVASGPAASQPVVDASTAAPMAGVGAAAAAEVLDTLLEAVDADFAAWDDHRLALGLPDGSRDLDAEHSVLLEAGFDELGGISWTKGCYMGQELTARTRYRGLVKRRLMPVALDGPPPDRDTPVTLDGREVGQMRSTRGGRGLALLRLGALTAPALICGETRVVPLPPTWIRLPETAA